MKNLTRLLVSAAMVIIITPSVFAQHVIKNASLGIGTINPAQKLQISGTNNTIRIDGLAGSFKVAPSAGAQLVYVNNADGDLYSMPVTNNDILYNNTGVPTWVTSATAFGAWAFTGGNTISATYGANFLGTLNNQPIQFRAVTQTTGICGVIDPIYQNIYFGGDVNGAVPGTINSSLPAGCINNVALGSGSFGNNSLTNFSSGVSNNVFIGYGTGLTYGAISNNNGSTAVGHVSSRYITTAVPNTSYGGFSLSQGNGAVTAGGANNVAMGYESENHHTTGVKDVALGINSLLTASTSSNNTAIGYQALDLTSTSQGNNTAIGWEASLDNTTGHNTTSIGYEANFTASAFYGNTAIGSFALFASTSSEPQQTAIGTGAMRSGTSATADYAVSIGDSSMYSNTAQNIVVIGTNASIAAAGTNSQIVAVGYDANMKNAAVSTDFQGMVFGYKALANATAESAYGTAAIGASAMGNGVATGGGNNAIGACALYNVTSGANNVAIGSANSITNTNNNAPLGRLTTGGSNVAIGFNSSSLTNGSNNVAIGANTLVGGNTTTLGTGNENTAIGVSATAGSTTGTFVASSFNTALGYSAVAGNNATVTVDYATAVGALASAIPLTGTTTATGNAAFGAGAVASANNATAIGALALANTANTIILGSISGVNGASSGVSVGIGTNNPAQELEIGGATNTMRLDGIATTHTFSVAPSVTSDQLLFAKSAGDLYSVPNSITNGSLMVLNGSGVPTWGAPPSNVTATVPLYNNGTSTLPNIILYGPYSAVVYGTGTGSAFSAVGHVGHILTDSLSVAVWDTVIPSSLSSSDNWGTQFVITDSLHTAGGKNTITGRGLTTSPLRLSKDGASNGQTLGWSSASKTWLPGAANTSLTTYNIAPAAGSVITVANGIGQVVGGSNVTLDLQGTAGGIFIGNGSGTAASFTSAGTTGQLLVSNGPGVAPTWQSQTIPVNWAITGNSGTTPGVNFLGTDDDKQFYFYTGGYAGNSGALDPQFVGATAYANVYLGGVNGNNSDGGAGNTDQGSYNVGLGFGAMGHAVGSTVVYNVAVGSHTLESISAGSMTGFNNTALGYASMWNSTTGDYATAVGCETIGGGSSNYNTGVGFQALYGQLSGSSYYGPNNTAIGYGALNTPTAGTGQSNTAAGTNSLYQTTGNKNTAAGDSSLYTNTSGAKNTALGYYANTTTATLTNATAIGAKAAANTSNTMILGAINGVNNATASTSVGIATQTPGRALEIGGTANTVRVDGTANGNLKSLAPTASTDQIMFAKSNGDVYSLPNGAGVLTLSPTGYPVWSAALSGLTVTATSPMVATTVGSFTNLSMQVTAGGIVYGTGASPSSAAILGAGTSAYALTSNGAGAPSWQPLPVPIPWSFTGNAGTNTSNFIGTTDDKQLRFYVTGQGGSYNGNAGSLDPLNVSGTNFGNVYMGGPNTNNGNGGAGQSSSGGTQDVGSFNVGMGFSAMGGSSTTTPPTYDVALGSHALEAINNGGAMASSFSVAIGGSAMIFTNTANGETAIGLLALSGGTWSSTTSNYNTTVGSWSMYGGQSSSKYFGAYNTAMGYYSLYTPSAGNGVSNTGVGTYSIYQSTGNRNTAAGDSALYSNTSGANNTAIGYYANVNTATLTNAAAIGAKAAANQSNTLVLGSINGVNSATANTNVAIGTQTPATDAALAIKNKHLETQVGSTAPTAVVNILISSNGGSGGFTAGQGSTDVAGGITFTTPTSSGFGPNEITVNFATNYAHAPTVVVAPSNTSAANAMTAYQVYVTSTTTGFTLNFNNIAGSANQTYNFNYFVVETQ